MREETAYHRAPLPDIFGVNMLGPVLMMFGAGNMPGEPLPRFGKAPDPAAPPSTEQLIAAAGRLASVRVSPTRASAMLLSPEAT